MNALQLDPVDRFGELIAVRFGLRFDETRRGFLAEVLGRRAGARLDEVDAWLARLEAGQASSDDLRKLAEELTVGETYFFRNIEQFKALEEVVIPARIAARGQARTLRVLSAGCASGEEPYSIAIVLRERVLALGEGWKVFVTGVDLNPAHLRRAAAARYTAWSLRELPKDVQQRWFHTSGREHVLADDIKSMVKLAERNLVEPDASLWTPELYDVIFCRNVLMYFTPAQAEAVVERMQQSLAPGGYLFLGHAESLRGLSHAFELRHTHGTFYYERRSGHELERVRADDSGWRERDGAPIVALVDATDSWITTIHDAAARIRELVDERRPTVDAVPDDTAARVAGALELLRQERYGDALDRLDGKDGAATRDPEVLLLRAVLLTHGGQLERAQAACEALLAHDGLNAGAHYLLALCAERSGELDRAIERDEAAAYLDDAFAMPRLHLGLMARRRRDRDVAQRELARALVLLEREDSARLLLFGGGFGRETLLALCRAELDACRGGR